VALLTQAYYDCVLTSYSFSFSKGERAVLYISNKHLFFQIIIYFFNQQERLKLCKQWPVYMKRLCGADVHSGELHLFSDVVPG